MYKLQAYTSAYVYKLQAYTNVCINYKLTPIHV